MKKIKMLISKKISKENLELTKMPRKMQDAQIK